MKDDSKKIKEGWHKWLDPKHEMLFVVKEAICCMNIKFFFKQEKEKKSSWKARCSRSYSHAQCKLSKNLTWPRTSTRANYTTLGIPGGTIEKTVANWRSHDGVSRRKLPRKLRKWEAICYQRAQQVASSLQSDMSQASSDCNSWKDGVWRLTKEVAEQSTKRIAGRAPRITHLFIHKHQEQIVRNPSRRQNEFIHHFSRCDPQKAIRGNIFCRLPLLYRTRDPFTLKVPQKGKKQRNSNLRNGRKRQEWNPFLATNSCVSSMPSAVPPESPCTSSRAADFHKQNER